MNDLKEIVIKNFADAAVVDNYRVSADGTLTKRDGFRVLASLGEYIRGYCYDGADVIYAVAGSCLYCVRNGQIYVIATLDGEAFGAKTERCIVYAYAGVVYMIGNGSFYSFDTTYPGAEVKSFEFIPVRESNREEYPVTAYNLISEKERTISLATVNSKIDRVLKSSPVCCVLLDDILLSESQYSITESGGYYVVEITDDSLLTESRIFTIVHYTSADRFTNKKELCSRCKNAYVYEGKSGVRVFLYGGEEGCIYYSEAVTLHVDEETGETIDMPLGTIIGDFYPAGNEIYAPGEGEMIRAILPYNERTLVITDRATYSLVEETKTTDDTVTFKRFRLVSIDNELGMGENSGVVSYDGKLYLISALGLYSLSYNPIEDKYSTKRLTIPDNVGVSRDDMDSVRLNVDRVNHELWLQNGDKCAVYSFNEKKWYRFSGFCPTSFFTYQNASAFTEGNRICVFTVGEILDGGVGFEAYVETHNLDLGNIFSEKTIYSFGATFERREGAALECTLKSDKGATFTFRMDADSSDADTSPVVKRTHARLGGCYYVICRVGTPADAAPANLRSILISYRVMGGNV